MYLRELLWAYGVIGAVSRMSRQKSNLKCLLGKHLWTRYAKSGNFNKIVHTCERCNLAGKCKLDSNGWKCSICGEVPISVPISITINKHAKKKR